MVLSMIVRTGLRLRRHVGRYAAAVQAEKDWQDSDKSFSALSALRRFPFFQLADGMLLRKCNLDHVTVTRRAIPQKGSIRLTVCAENVGGRDLRHTPGMRSSLYHRHRFPAEIIIIASGCIFASPSAFALSKKC